LLLLDEPFAGVDKRSESMLIQVLKQMRSEGATVLVSTHDLASLRAFADDALLLRQTILMHDTPQAVLAPENLVQAFGMQVQAGADSGASDEQTRREEEE
ncbi:MAG: ABC transporter, partial [Rothia dentocariosa]